MSDLYAGGAGSSTGAGHHNGMEMFAQVMGPVVVAVLLVLIGAVAVHAVRDRDGHIDITPPSGD